MPGNSEYFPAAMRQLSEVARHNAIEIVNTLFAQGMGEGKAIRIAIAKARA